MNKSANVFDSMLTVKDISQAENFKEAIDKLLDMRQQNYKHLAEELEYSKAHIWGVATGRYRITLDLAKKLHRISALSTVFWLELWIDTYDPD